jgi:nucleoside-diphosphate-sugar epimerase
VKQLRIGITGASGFIGQELVRLLSAQGHDLVLLSRSAKKWKKRSSVTVIEADLSQPQTEAIAKFTDGLDVVFHLAAELNKPSMMHVTNVVGTQAIVDALAKKTTLIYLSSIGIFDFKQGDTIYEDSPCRPQNEYEKSKLAAEKIIRNQVGLKSVILRPSIILGQKMKSGLLQQLVRLCQKKLHLKVDQKVIANFVLATDVVDALLHLSNTEKAIGQEYNFSRDIPLSQFLSLLEQELKVQNSIPIPARLFQQLLKFFRFIKLLSISKDGVAFFSNTTKIPSNKIVEELNFEFKADYRSFLKEYVNCTR